MEETDSIQVECTISRMVMISNEGDTEGEEDTVGCLVEMGVAVAVCFYPSPISQHAVKPQASCSFL